MARERSVQIRDRRPLPFVRSKTGRSRSKAVGEPRHVVATSKTFRSLARIAGAGLQPVRTTYLGCTVYPAFALVKRLNRRRPVSLAEPAGGTALVTRQEIEREIWGNGLPDSDTLRSHTGQIAFPGGRCDPGETPWVTALREANEEVGLDPACVTLAGLLHGYQTVTGFHVTPVVGFIDPKATFVASPEEVADVFETPFDFLMDPANHRQDSRMWQGTVRHFYVMPYRERHIWGITAGIIRTLYERLYA